jgi:hypothetical protein
MNLVKIEAKNKEELVFEDDSAYEEETKEENLSMCAKIGLAILGLVTIGYGVYKAYDCVADSDDEIEKLDLE